MECIGKYPDFSQLHPIPFVFQVFNWCRNQFIIRSFFTNLTHLNDYLSVKIEKELLKELLERFKYYHDKLLNYDEFLFDKYHANWLHNGQIDPVENFPGKILKIKGIDEFGYLIAVDSESTMSTSLNRMVNSFDMMKILFKCKQ